MFVDMNVIVMLVFLRGVLCDSLPTPCKGCVASVAKRCSCLLG